MSVDFETTLVCNACFNVFSSKNGERFLEEHGLDKKRRDRVGSTVLRLLTEVANASFSIDKASADANA